MNVVERIDEVMRSQCETRFGTQRMTLAEAGRILEEYGRHPTAELAARKWDVIESVVWNAPGLTVSNRDAFYNAAFRMAWTSMDDYRTTQYDIRARLIDPILAMLRQPARPQRMGAARRVAILCGQTMVGGPYANTRNLHSYLMGKSGRFEWCWYNYGPSERAVVGEITGGGVMYRSFDGDAERKIDAIAAALAEDRIDVVISDMYWHIPLALYARRAAPLWLHLSPGFQKMPADAVLLPDTQEPFDERCVPIPYVLDARYLRQSVAPLPRLAPIVLGTMARHAKVSAEFRAEVSKILDRHPTAVYVLCGAGDLSPWHPRVTIAGVQNVHAVLPNIDVFLDTWPLCGCMAVMEAQAHGVPVVTLTQPCTESYDAFKGGVVHTLGEYHELVDALIDGIARPTVIEAGHEGIARLTDVHAGCASLERAIERLWGEP